MKKYLFLFTISPVQTFIAQARKTQDLYAGSRILSELIRAGIEQFQDEEIIFPRLAPGAVSAPNRFIALINNPEGELKAIGEKVESNVRNAFVELAKTTLKKESKLASVAYDQQISQHLTIHWTFQELNGDYKTAYTALENSIGSIKNVRPFQQFTYQAELGEKGRKCSLDGERNAVFYKTTSTKRMPAMLTENGAIELSSDKLNDGEGLSALGFLKRFAQWEDQKGRSFPSTAEIALLHDINVLSTEEKEYLKWMENLHQKGNTVYQTCMQLHEHKLIKEIELKNINEEEDWQTNFDYQACFEENLTDKNYPNVIQLKLIKTLQQKLKKGLHNKYYALVMFDGDKMGEHLQTITDKGSDGHTAFSKKLSDFAHQAAQYVDKNRYGKTVYAGGDDFLGFINLYYLFDVMEELREMFQKTVGSQLHFSAGIVIAHYKIPLSEVLKTTSSVEKMAKNEGGRNAFCITAIRHSGEIQQAVFKWGSNNKNWRSLKEIIEAVKKVDNKEAAFSTKFIQNLTIEIGRLGGMKGILTNDGIVKAEIKRLVGRSKNGDATQIKTDQLVLAVSSLWDAFYETMKDEGSNRVQNFIHAIHIADFISRKTN